MKSLGRRKISYAKTALLTVMLALPVICTAQSNRSTGSQMAPNRGSSDSKRLEKMDAQLRSVETKVNQLIQSQGGRFIFLVSGDGEFVRLDTHEGEIAVFNLVKGAQWFTLDIPERTIRPGDAFYEQFVQTIDKLEFNTN